MRELIIGGSITSRDTDSLNKYLAEIGRIPLLTAEEEVQLTRRIKTGDKKALEYLVRTNLRFVVSVAKKYQHRGLSLGDLINEGNLGLIKAASRFDETKGFKFISFAVWWIRQSMMLALAEQTRVIRLPLNMINSITKLNRTISGLEQELERHPTADEIAGKLSLKEQKITKQLKSAQKCKSLDEVVNQEIGSTLLDVLVANIPETDHLVGTSSGLMEITRTLKTLSKREMKVLNLYFGLEGTDAVSLDDIAALLNLSRERIRQLKDGAVKKIRAGINGKKNK